MTKHKGTIRVMVTQHIPVEFEFSEGKAPLKAELLNMLITEKLNVVGETTIISYDQVIGFTVEGNKTTPGDTQGEVPVTEDAVPIQQELPTIADDAEQVSS